jgi:hypothetical protein
MGDCMSPWLHRSVFFGEAAENGTRGACAPRITGAAPIAVHSI